jgi:hypothetical protein
MRDALKAGSYVGDYVGDRGSGTPALPLAWLICSASMVFN